jgi:hypothetical protein
MFVREDFLALDKLTLAEIETLFAPLRARQAVTHIKTPSSTGRAFSTVPGAIFYEVEDLI